MNENIWGLCAPVGRPDVPWLVQALVAEIEQNQTKLDECQTHSKQYCTSVKVRARVLREFTALCRTRHTRTRLSRTTSCS